MKYLILGCNGMFGHMLSFYLMEQGHEVTGLAQNKQILLPTIIADARNVDKLKTIIKEGDYDAVINCIGILNQKAEENKKDAVFLNSYLPHVLADLTKTSSTQIIHISTDCVFSGKRGSYKENDFKDGDTFYDRTKAIGELDDNKNITLRNSIVGPDMKEDGIGLLNCFLRQTGPVYGYKKVLWSGLTSLQLAKVAELMTTKKISGLYNAVNNEKISKYELLELFNKYLRRSKIKIIPSDEVVLDKILVRTREWDFVSQTCDVLSSYESMVEDLRHWMQKHQHLYVHYYS